MPSPIEQRLSFEAPIYEMETRLGEMEAHYAKKRALAEGSTIHVDATRDGLVFNAEAPAEPQKT